MATLIEFVELGKCETTWLDQKGSLNISGLSREGKKQLKFSFIFLLDPIIGYFCHCYFCCCWWWLCKLLLPTTDPQWLIRNQTFMSSLQYLSEYLLLIFLLIYTVQNKNFEVVNGLISL